MKLTGTFLLITLLLAAIPVKAEVAEIRNPSWRELPNTGDSTGEARSVAINGVVRSGNIVRYDTMTSNGADFTGLTSNAKDNQVGVIQGRLSYPSDFVPPMRVCAQSVSNYYLMNCINTEARDRSSFQNFKLTVSPGKYLVFAYASREDSGASFDYQAYHASSNQPIPIQVSAGKVITNIQVNQWQLCRRNPRPSYCIAPSRSPSQPQSNQSQQSGTVRFTNPNWRVVPGAAVGRNPAETSMNMNSLSREGDTVTFEVIGYKGSYQQMTGNCSTRQVAVTRQGLQTRNGANYQGTAPNEVPVTSWHRRLLRFACQNSPR